jgi:hypothetical protein
MATQAARKHLPLTIGRKEAIKVDARFKNLVMCIDQTWQVIAADAMACCEETGEGPLTKGERLELVLDANYMSTNCGNEGKEAEKFMDELFKTYAYASVVKMLKAEVYL